ncbi:hypothetical protein [Kineosporia sp. R_H_3]|uniref:hypothetical protein n=1 Tax=Kineosporia sp. R_H_3 TaxID=1961848 RepID=UPI000B4AB581|nr:hypothetical protein [Kineosporia sp. R_H_3]
MRTRTCRTATVTTVAAAFVLALAGCAGGSPGASGTTGTAPTTSAPTATTGPAAPSTTSPGRTSTTPPPSTSSTSAGVPALRHGYLPLWPFASGRQVLAWQRAYRSAGTQAWHRSERETAVAFAHGYLGYSEIDRVTSRAGTASDALVGVGWADPNGRDVTVGLVHLLRFGTGADAPWEVVGTRDTVLSLTSPRYGSTVTSPMTVGGRITGVDESLVVAVRSLPGTDPLVETEGVPAGGEDTPWRMRVPFTAPDGAVLTVSVSTGGHLMAVEAFAVTGVRVSSATGR